MPEPLELKAVLFDLEGTLVDFQWNLKEAAAEILDLLAAFDIDPGIFGPHPDYAHLYNTTQKIITAWPKDRKAELLKQLGTVYDRYDADALSRWKLYPDTLETLESLSQATIPMGVVSNCGRNAVDKVVKKFQLHPFFNLIISRNDVTFVKPHPQGLTLACRQIGLPEVNTLYVGDSVNDIIPASQIGMPSCFLKIGESRVSGITLQNADFEITHLSQIMGFIQ